MEIKQTSSACRDYWPKVTIAKVRQFADRNYKCDNSGTINDLGLGKISGTDLYTLLGL